MSEIKPTVKDFNNPYVLQLIEALAKQDDEIERLETLAADAIKYLTDEIGVGDDPVAFVCAAYVASRQEIDRLKVIKLDNNTDTLI